MSRIAPDLDQSFQTNQALNELSPRGRSRRRVFGAVINVSLVALAAGCASGSSQPDQSRKPRLAENYSDQSFLGLSPQAAQERLEVMRKSRPDCIIEPKAVAVDEEIDAMVAQRSLYSPLPDPKDPGAAANVKLHRNSISSSLKKVGEDLKKIDDPTTRARTLASRYRLISESALKFSTRSGTPPEIVDESRDASECFRVKAHSIVIQLILKTAS